MARPRKLIQTVLRSTAAVPNGYTETVAWLPEDKRVKVGSVISLEGDPANTKWKVTHQADRMYLYEINKFWKVGGLT